MDNHNRGLQQQHHRHHQQQQQQTAQHNSMVHGSPSQQMHQQVGMMQQQYYTQQQMQHAQHAAAQNNSHMYNYNNRNNNTHQPTSTTPIINGPRSKCNQVIYEAIAKSCEIAVRGRCTDLIDDSMIINNNDNSINNSGRGYSDGMINNTTSIQSNVRTSSNNNERSRRHSSYSYGKNNHQATSSNNSNSTSSRFNIEVDEVPSIRSIVSSTWKRNIHVPLRLDIYYEHDACYDVEQQQQQQQNEMVGQTNGEGENQHQNIPPPAPPPPQRELLERWCIDYIPSTYTSSSSTTLNNLNSSLSSSPSTSQSPYSSPYSSRIMTGTTVSSSSNTNHNNVENKSSSSSSMSQLRQVCKRIVVLLRSLHCMTRMLPAYRLKCMLLSNLTNGNVGGLLSSVTRNPSLVMGATHDQEGRLFLDTNGNQIGWGHIGYSIHVGEISEQNVEPALPSPSFARQTLPIVQTSYGQLNLSVMYDATLNPNYMICDISERRNEWMQRQLYVMQTAGAVPRGVVPYHDGQHYHYQHQGGGGMMTPTHTQPIPITTHHVVEQHASPGRSGGGGGGGGGQPLVINSLPQNALSRREYGSCPPRALRMGGGPNSFGSSAAGGGGRMRALSDFINPDYHSSPKLKPISSPTSSGGLENNSNAGGRGVKPNMSGLSLAMMNEDDNTSPVGHVLNNKVGPSQQQQLHHHAHSSQKEVDDNALLLPFGSPATRAAFHNPPPLYGEQQAQAQSSGISDQDNRGTHFFQRHGGYGYGYNGSNLQFDTDQQQQQQEVSSTPGSAGDPNIGLSMSPNPRQGMHSTMPQHPLSPSVGISQQHHHTSRSGTTPPTSVLSSRPLTGGSPKQQYQQGSDGGRSSSNVQRSSSSRHRASSSSVVQLLPPVNSLDILQKSPFVMARKAAAAEASDKEEEGERLLSSIPRMVTNEQDRSDSIAVSTLGEGGSSTNNNQFVSGAQHESGNILRGRTNTEELPFSVDDDDNNPLLNGAASSSPFKSSEGTSRSLWGSTKADVLEGTLGGGGGMAETLAASSLAHRCATDGKIRLKMFDCDGASGSGGGGGGDGLNPAATSASNGPPSIKDQLSEFKSFGASLMLGSTGTEGD